MRLSESINFSISNMGTSERKKQQQHNAPLQQQQKIKQSKATLCSELLYLQE